MELKVKAYGKILIFGAYSILEPNHIGLVVNIDKGTTTTVKEEETGRIVIDLSNFEIKTEGEYKKNIFSLRKESDVMKYIKNAVDYSFQYLTYNKKTIRDVKLISVNDPELIIDNKLKTGLGSSATATVSAVAAVLAAHDIDDRKIIYKISRYSHYKSQGNKGSGFDIASACFGSHFFISGKSNLEEDFFKYMASEDKTIRKGFDWPQALFPVVIFTGKSASTEQFVKKFLEYKLKNKTEYDKYLYVYNQVNMKVKEAFENNDFEGIKNTLSKSLGMRKKLGELAKIPIETEKATALINKIKEKGAYIAGLIGAGGGDSILALCMTYKNKKTLLDFLESEKMTVLDNINIINQGYKLLD